MNADPPTVTVTDADGSALGRSRRDVQGKRLVLETAPDGPEVAALKAASTAAGTRITEIDAELADVEALQHADEPDNVHFHEVGAVDSIADICGCAIAWDLLGVDRIYCSPVPTGRRS